MYVNGKMILAGTVPRVSGWGEFKYDIFDPL
jgi:hypothetical protein